MLSIHPYLNFPGNTEEAFEFYRSVFGGDFAMLMRFKEMPGADDMPAAARDKIMHISLPVGSTMLMASDAMPGMGPPLTAGNNFSLSIGVDSQAQADRLFAALSAGGQVTMPMQKQFWGDYFGMCTDKFGVQWMVSWEDR